MTQFITANPFEEISYSLGYDLPLETNLALLEELKNLPDLESSFRLVIRDVYAYALNNSQEDLEMSLMTHYPDIIADLYDDLNWVRYVWLYCQIYQRPDLEAIVTPLLLKKEGSLPWHKVLAIAISEDIDDAIQTSLLEGNFKLEDLLEGLVAAYRLGNQEIINYIGALVGPDWDIFVAKGYLLYDLPSAEIPYVILFTDRDRYQGMADPLKVV